MTLKAFFETSWPFFKGRRSTEDVVSVLGPSSSGLARLSLYPTLVKAQHVQALETFFSPLQRASRASNHVPTFHDLIEEFLTQHELHGRNPSSICEPFVEFIETRCSGSQALPVWMAELADFAWASFVVASEPAQGRDVLHDAIVPGLRVRHYTHAVAQYSRQNLEGVPAAAATTVFLFRRDEKSGASVFYASAAHVLALAQVTGAARGTPLSISRIRAALRELESAGVLHATTDTEPQTVRVD